MAEEMNGVRPVVGGDAPGRNLRVESCSALGEGGRQREGRRFVANPYTGWTGERGRRYPYLEEEVVAECGDGGVGLGRERGVDGREIHRRRRRRRSPAV